MMDDNTHLGPHLSSEQMSAFIENVLPEHERRQALTHIAECITCRDIAFLAQESLPQEVVETAEQPHPRRWFAWLWLPATALACAVLLSVTLYLHRARPTIPTVSTAYVDVPVPQTEQPSTSGKSVDTVKPHERVAHPVVPLQPAQAAAPAAVAGSLAVPLPNKVAANPEGQPALPAPKSPITSAAGQGMAVGSITPGGTMQDLPLALRARSAKPNQPAVSDEVHSEANAAPPASSVTLNGVDKSSMTLAHPPPQWTWQESQAPSPPPQALRSRTQRSRCSRCMATNLLQPKQT